MTIEDIYREIVTRKIIMQILHDEQLPTPSRIKALLDEHIAAGHNLSEPAHTLANTMVTWGENSSASKYNSTLSDIQNDLTVLYRALLDISNSANFKFERWRTKATVLEDRLAALVDRLSDLLLLQQDTAGYYNFIQVDFKTLTDFDLTNTTARLDTKQGHGSIGTSSTSVTRYFPLSNGIAESDINFVSLTRQSVSAIVSSQQSSLRNAFDGTTAYWQERIHTSKPVTVSCELVIKLHSSTAVTLSRVDIDIHASNKSDAVQVLPMYSTDGKTWNKLPITDYFLSVTDRGTFQFAPVSALYFKFIFTKAGPDQVLSTGGYVYEFGVDDIAFYNEAYSTSTSGVQIITNPLSIANLVTKANETFSKVTLEVCELIETGTTDIEYAVAASSSSSVVPSTATWMPISPLGRSNPSRPKVIDFGETSYVEKSGIQLSYDPLNTNGAFVDPKQTFTVLTGLTGTVTTEETATASARRYHFQDTSFKILDFEISNDIQIAKGSIELWRNVNTKGSNALVRGYPNGWKIDGDYYKATVLVKNANGIEIDFGAKPIIIDDVSISGKYTVTKGVHSIKVHKDVFFYVDDSAITTLTELKTADRLYPYNHRYLVEGFNYPGNWSTSEEKVYKGFDIVAESLMQQVGVVDMLSSVKPDDFTKFAIDLDAQDTGRAPSTLGTSSYKVFLVRIDNTNTDMTNEKFYLRFRPKNVEYEYVMLRAILKSTDQNKTPYLSSLRLKVGS